MEFKVNSTFEMCPTSRLRGLPGAEVVASSADPPAIDGTAVQELLGSHHAVALEDQPILHHEGNGTQSVDVLEGISFHGNHVGRETDFERAAPVVNVAYLVAVD